MALLSPSFSTGGESSWDCPALPLSKCYEDLRSIAAEGGGFDAGWKRKARY